MRMNNDYLIEYVNKHFRVDEVGNLHRLDRKNSTSNYKDKDGYKIVKIKGCHYKQHIICWILYYGSYPNNTIDHINGIRCDNRKGNLRCISHKNNCKNRHNFKNKYQGIYKAYSTSKGDYFRTHIEGKSYGSYDINELILLRKKNGYNNGINVKIK